MPACLAMTFRLPAENPRAPNSCMATSVMRARLSAGRFRQVAVGTRVV